jgi:acetyl-CoA carboxylase biotin carboxyl carrier protein
MDFNQLKQILNLVDEYGLAEFEIEHEGLRLKVRKDSAGVAPVVPAAAPAPPLAVAPAGGSASAAPPAAAVEGKTESANAVDAEIDLAVVKSPSSARSTALRARRPVVCRHRHDRQKGGWLHHRGDEIDERDRLRCDGEIVNIYVENGQSVQCGEQLFAIKCGRPGDGMFRKYDRQPRRNRPSRDLRVP